MQNVGSALVKIDSLDVLRGPSAPTGKWYILFTVDGQSRGWFNHAVKDGCSYPVGYVFRVGRQPSPANVTLQVAGFEDRGSDPVVLPLLRCTVELPCGLDGAGSKVAACAGYGVSYSVTHDASAAAEPAEVGHQAFPIQRRHRQTRTFLALALLALGLYGSALLSIAF